jgi:hypothetical protein
VRRLLVSAKIAPCSASPLHARRDACKVVERDGTWRESFAEGVFIARATPAPVTLRHDGPSIGYVFTVAAHGGWHLAELVLEVDDVQRELIRPGRAVSIDARSIRRDDDLDLHLRRHRLATLDAVAVLADGERPWYVGAEIVSVREAPARVAAATLLDPDLGGIVLREGDEVIDHERGTVHRYEAGVLVLQ